MYFFPKENAKNLELIIFEIYKKIFCTKFVISINLFIDFQTILGQSQLFQPFSLKLPIQVL